MPRNDASRALAALSRRVRRSLPGAADRADRILARRVADEAPVLSGELAASVRVEPARMTAAGAAGGVAVDDDKAAHVEFGTDDAPPEPFARPALAAEGGRMARSIAHDIARQF